MAAFGVCRELACVDGAEINRDCLQLTNEQMFGIIGVRYVTEGRKMSIHGASNVEMDSLKRWIGTLSTDGLEQIDIGGHALIIDDNCKQILNAQIDTFSKCINEVNEDCDWRTLQGILSPAFYNAFIRLDNSSIRMGNYYECLIEPTDIKTYKKIISGFDYIDIGEIRIEDEKGVCIATIGQKSDLIWQVFYDYFINDNADGSMDHVYSNHERYLSIQLYDVEGLPDEEIKNTVNELLIQVFMQYEMRFRVFEVEPIIKSKGTACVRTMKSVPLGFESIPMLYLSNAINATDERMAFLGFYQVIEYFFVRTQNYYFLEQIKQVDVSSVNHNQLRKILGDYRKVCNEREALRLVFDKAIDVAKFKKWITSKQSFIDDYCKSLEYKIDISKSDKKIISSLVERVYAYRCSIAHAKGDVEEYIAVPSLSRERIAAELPLIQYLAFNVLTECSEVV